MTEKSIITSHIDGQWRASDQRDLTDNINPARPTEILNRIAPATVHEVDAAVDAADRALPVWRATPMPQRMAMLYRFADLLDTNKERIGRIITREQGKPLAEGMGEVGRAASEARFMAGETARMEGHTFPSEKPGRLAYSVLEPLGVVAAICPWNFPVVAPVRKIAPALACGNTVVLKPASATAWSAAELIDLLVEAGVPAGVVNFVPGAGREAGSRLVEHPKVAGVSFTGSTEIGRGIAAAAGQRLIPVQLELGGKNPALVWDGADLDRAADEIVGAAFQCTGQRCTAISRVIVNRDQAESLIDKLKARIRALTIGDGLEEGTTLGPLVSRRQLDTMDHYVSLAQDSGLSPIVGGKWAVDDPNRDGYFFQPTLFTDVDPDSPLAQEEMFGPILPIIPVNSLDQAIVIANDTRYGLAASLFTADMATALRCLEAIDAGMVHINHGTASQAHTPFGGIKESGLGPYSIGHTATDFFARTKMAYVDPA